MLAGVAYRGIASNEPTGSRRTNRHSPAHYCSHCRFISVAGVWTNYHIPSANECVSFQFAIAHIGGDHVYTAGALDKTTVPAVSPSPQTDPGATVVLALAVAETPGDLPAYNSDDWRHWIDEDGDCQDTRNEVLAAESLADVTYRSDRRCRVDSGRWLAPYSGAVIAVPGDLDIDQMVPLANAHHSGAWQWSPERQRLYANYLDDPSHLIAVMARANRSKGARGPDQWKPPDGSYWCQYAVDWKTVKFTWELTATPEELAALEEMLETCETPHQLGVVVTFERPNLPPFGGSSPTPTPADGTPTAQYGSCDEVEAAGENRVRGSRGSGRGFPKAMVPSARDGDGVVYER